MNMLLWATHVTDAHHTVLEKIKSADFDGVEIFVGEGDRAHYERLRRTLHGIGLACTTVTALDSETNPVSPDPAVRSAALDRLKWAVDMSAALSSKVLCGPYHSAYSTFTGAPPQPDELKRCAEVMRKAAEHASQAGVVLAVENLNRFECYLLTTVAQACELAQRVDHPAFGVLYDTHHAHIEEASVREPIAQAGGLIKHVHVSENNRGTPGRGQVRWRDNFRALHEIGYDGWLVIESFSRLNPDFASSIHVWRDFSPSAETVYEEGIRFIRELWEETKR